MITPRYFVNNMVGKRYPFFLGNQNLTSGYYVYQIYSPKLNDYYEPCFSITKVVEKTQRPEQLTGKDTDVLATILGNKFDREKMFAWAAEAIKKDGSVYKEILKEDDFPYFYPKTFGGNGAQKSIIVNLRDNLRWKNYRFLGGRLVDVLWTRTEFVVFKVFEDERYIWLEPQAAYKNSDTELKNPIDVDITKIDYKLIKYDKEKSPYYASDMNREIKAMEWNSFGRKYLVDRRGNKQEEAIEQD